MYDNAKNYVELMMKKCSNILIFNINTWMISIKFQTCIFVHNFCLFVTHVLSVSIRFVWMNKLNINIWWFYFIIIKFFAFLTISLLISLKEENKNTEKLNAFEKNINFEMLDNSPALWQICMYASTC